MKFADINLGDQVVVLNVLESDPRRYGYVMKKKTNYSIEVKLINGSVITVMPTFIRAPLKNEKPLFDTEILEIFVVSVTDVLPPMSLKFDGIYNLHTINNEYVDTVCKLYKDHRITTHLFSTIKYHLLVVICNTEIIPNIPGVNTNDYVIEKHLTNEGFGSPEWHMYQLIRRA